jgi:RNA polymerase sigma-70 factor (ECF subfamily)
MNTNPNSVPDPAWTPEEYEELLDNCFSILKSTAFGITKNKESAEDIVMKNFHKLLEGRSVIKPDKDPCSQLKACVINDCKSYLTGKMRSENRNAVFWQKHYAENDPDVEQQIIGVEDSIRLHKETEKLPPECKKIFKLYFFEGLSIRDIAIHLNKNERNVRSQKDRGVNLLKKRLGGFDLFPLPRKKN